MKIAICGSLDFTHQIKQLADDLRAGGYEVDIPITSQRILDGQTTVEQIKAEKDSGTFADRAIKFDSIREYWAIIQRADAILVANYDKKGITNYIGGNSFLEMGFAHVLNKQIFLLNDIPDMIYSDEIKAMQPVALGGDIDKIAEHAKDVAAAAGGGEALIQIVDEQDNPIGQATKQEAWAKGLRHRVVRIMTENDRGEILVQHRTPTKDIFPNCWDTSAAGHVDAGEDYQTAAYRELKEELGIEDVQLEELGGYDDDEIWWGHRFRRFTRVYRLRYNVTPQKLEQGKVDGVAWMPLDQVKNLVKNHPNEVTDGLRQVIEKYYS